MLTASAVVRWRHLGVLTLLPLLLDGIIGDDLAASAVVRFHRVVPGPIFMLCSLFPSQSSGGTWQKKLIQDGSDKHLCITHILP